MLFRIPSIVFSLHSLLTPAPHFFYSIWSFQIFSQESKKEAEGGKGTSVHLLMSSGPGVFSKVHFASSKGSVFSPISHGTWRPSTSPCYFHLYLSVQVNHLESIQKLDSDSVSPDWDCLHSNLRIHLSIIIIKRNKHSRTSTILNL